MDQEAKHELDRGRGGFVGIKHLVIILLVFGAYTGYKFLPVELTKSKIEHGIVKAFEQINHRSTDEQIQANVARFVKTAGVTLEREAVQVGREQSQGQRVIHVDIYHPITVNYLGSERTVNKHIHQMKVIHVNEAAEAAYAEQIRRQEEQRQRDNEAEREYAGRFQEMWAECERIHGRGGCQVQYMPGGGGDRFGQIQRHY
jgi:hypothetical protein